VTLHCILWLWKGWRPVYDRRDVAYIARQLLTHGDLPQRTRIVCLTDRPTDWHRRAVTSLGVLELPLWGELPGLRVGHAPAYPWLPQRQGQPNCYRRLRIFDPATQASLGIAPGDLILSMDLDSVVMGSLSVLLAPFYDGVSPPDFMAMGGRVSPIHGSLFAFRAGTCRQVWDQFDPATTPAKLRHPPPGWPRYVGSDQAWLSTVLGKVPLWGTNEGVWSWSRHHTKLRPSDPVTYMSFAGASKPRGALCAMHTPWIHAHAMKHWED